MESNKKKLIGKTGAAVHILLTITVFLVFTFKVIPPHVPFYDPVWKFTFSAYTSLVMSGFFWMACNLFHVTLVDQLQRRQEAKA